MTQLPWPAEQASRDNNPDATWFNRSSNYCLDFHGDPVSSDLTVYSDGNHHMALEQALETYRKENDLSGIFYCTTPPKVYLDLMQEGFVDLGNLRLSNQPDLVIGPDNILTNLREAGRLNTNRSFMQSRGNALLVRKGNPTGIADVADLFKPDCRLFISNPVTENASYVVYRETIENFGRDANIDQRVIAERFDRLSPAIVFGENIHHREAPAAVVSESADVAMVYYHLALRYIRIFPDLFDLVEVPFDDRNVTTVYNVGASNKESVAAAHIEAFFHSDACRAIYAYHGLGSGGY